jgi:CheY-like chemotaxis protein
VRSEAGRGTTVRITLPEAAQRPGPDADGEAATPAGAGQSAVAEACEGTILYVEDNAVNQLIVRQMLARWPGLRLVMADNGARGLALAQELAPDLVLLDMRLPDMSGTELLDALRADPVMRALRVVALSASAMPDEVALARERGALEYWTKPLDYATFLADVQRLMCPHAATRAPE